MLSLIRNNQTYFINTWCIFASGSSKLKQQELSNTTRYPAKKQQLIGKQQLISSNLVTSLLLEVVLEQGSHLDLHQKANLYLKFISEKINMWQQHKKWK